MLRNISEYNMDDNLLGQHQVHVFKDLNIVKNMIKIKKGCSSRGRDPIIRQDNLS